MLLLRAATPSRPILLIPARTGYPMILNGIEATCALTGFVPRHATACATVADQLDCIILFRERGRAAQGLIAEDYSM